MPFRLSKNTTTPVQMMKKESEYPMTYVHDLLMRIIELPYVNNELSMIILLPDDIEDGSTGLEKLERELTYEKFVEWTNPETMYTDTVKLSLPKFKLEDDYDLKSVLINMGMSDAFDIGRSDFSGMSGNNDLVLSKVVHKSFVEVNEEGTEAAGATGVVIVKYCVLLNVPTFTCDHPFLFFIMHKQSRSILFCGRFSSP
ncbi:hypothetical protein FKM82_006488 [Ascaphus truei]